MHVRKNIKLMTRDYRKVLKSIESCKTSVQIHNAIKLITFFDRKWRYEKATDRLAGKLYDHNSKIVCP